MGRCKGSKNKVKAPLSNNGNNKKELDLSYSPVLSITDFQSWDEARGLFKAIDEDDGYDIDRQDSLIDLCEKLQRISGLIQGTCSAVRASWERQEFTQMCIEDSVLEQQETNK